ncbi:MAG: YbhB/YbcL family Raf kinase inhibitor-like protein [Isosphaeraceae bacterium]
MRSASGFSLTSAAFGEGQDDPRRHTGDGEDLSPPLSWSGLPRGRGSLALVVDDPDAPSAEPWVHWVIYDIPARLEEIPEGVHQADRPPFPEGASQGSNSWGTTGYRGPAPPRGHGVHHYHFTLYALDAPLKLLAGLDKRGLLKAMAGHVLDRADLVGTYERPR